MSAPRRSRLAFVTTHGMTLRILAHGQLAHLRHHGFEVVAMAAPGADLETVAAREEVATFGVRGLRREISPLADLAALLRLWRLLRRTRPDLVVAGTPKAGLLATAAARLAGVPRCVYVLRGLRMETATGSRRRLLAITERLASHLAHRVLCVSPSLRRRYVDDLRLAPAVKVRVPGDGSSNGVDVERFRPPVAGGPGAVAELPRATPEETRAAAALAAAGDGPVIGFVGRFTHDKGIDSLAAAWSGGLRHRFPTARLLLLGGWEDGDPVASTTRSRLEEDSRVVFAGFIADPAPWYRAMSVLAFPSHREGFPNAPLEAAASGLPVVAFAATGTVEAVVDGVTGTLVPVGDAEALAGALARYLDDPALARRHGDAGRRRAVERFAQPRVWAAWAAEYEAALHEDGEAASASRPAQVQRHRLYRHFVKRLLDLAVTLPALILLAPVLWAVAFLVRLFLGSPVLFRQVRPGRGGRPFTLLKFRTMTDDTDADGRPLPDDQRLTRFGRFLRRTSLDELPELLNVVRGDMSLVGPRPLLVQYLKRYTPRQARRHEVRPGMTGWAVVHGRNDLTWEEKLELDIEYVERLSPALDLAILLATVRLVATGRGVRAAGHSTMPEFMGSDPSTAADESMTTEQGKREA